MKLFTKTFGCQMNFADSDEMTRHFLGRGYTLTQDQKEADTVLINTCTVRDLAEQKGRSYVGRLKEWKRLDHSRTIVVTGCAAERAKNYFRKNFPHVDLVVGAKDIDQFPEELDALLSNRVTAEENLVPPSVTGSHSVGPSTVVQYVTTMRGCNYSCSYCIVPSVRGRERYIPIQEILDNVQQRVEEGAKEIWLLGQTVNSYKPTDAPKPDYDFADLLRDVDQVPGVERIRFMSPHPFYVNEKFVDALAECQHVCENLHLPAQSGSTSQLKKMRRTYTRESYLKCVEMLKKKIPNIGLSTDLIVGFPGETDEDFQQTLDLVREVNFDAAYCFKYSMRPGTEAAQWEDDVPMEVKDQRVNTLIELVERQGQEKAPSFVGSTQTILIEEKMSDGSYRGRTRTAWKTRVKDDSLKLGDMVDVKIEGHYLRELRGQVLSSKPVV